MAPMSLVTYDEVRPWACAIRTRVMDRSMPPWHIDKTIGIQAHSSAQRFYRVAAPARML